MHYTLLYIGLGLLLYQAERPSFDYGTGFAAVGTALVAVFTIWNQIQQNKLKARVTVAESAASSVKEVLEAWKRVVEARDKIGDMTTTELDRVRTRLGQQEAHTKFCERGQFKLVLLLIKAGVEIDIDKLFGDLTLNETQLRSDLSDLHTTGAGPTVSVEADISLAPEVPTK